MNDFDIKKEEAETIFREMIIPQTINGFIPKQDREVFLLGGQPGSGKSALVREIIKKNKNLVFINGDDLRAYHPKYYFYLKENDEEAADRTQAVCNFWAELLVKECILRNLNFIIEGTMRKKEVSLNTTMLLRDAGYSINLAAVSVPYELSLRSLEYRYEELKKLGQQARFTKKESHDEAFQNSEKTLIELVNSNLFKKFYIYKRYFGGFEESIFDPGQGEEILKNFKEGRERFVEKEEIEKPIFATENGFNAIIK